MYPRGAPRRRYSKQQRNLFFSGWAGEARQNRKRWSCHREGTAASGRCNLLAHKDEKRRRTGRTPTRTPCHVRMTNISRSLRSPPVISAHVPFHLLGGSAAAGCPVYLTRHGESVGNQSKSMGGDGRLSERGDRYVRPHTGPGALWSINVYGFDSEPSGKIFLDHAWKT